MADAIAGVAEIGNALVVGTKHGTMLLFCSKNQDVDAR